MYSSELHRGVNDLISISARWILLFILALNRRMISILCFFFVAEVNGVCRSAAGEPFFIPFMTRGLVDSSHSHLASPSQGLFTAEPSPLSIHEGEKKSWLWNARWKRGNRAFVTLGIFSSFHLLNLPVHIPVRACERRTVEAASADYGGGIQVTHPAFHQGFPSLCIIPRFETPRP